jgi:RimJ/RimL family protein N-acetyltransferase
MAEEGIRSAVLETGDGNAAAIKTYLKLGFKPEYTDGTHKKRWERIYHMINNNDPT